MIRRSLRLFALLAALAAAALAQQVTVVTGAVYAQTGSVTASVPYTFETADGYIIPAGKQYTAAIAGGRFSIGLPPNAGGTPSSTYYNITYVYNPSNGAPGSTASEVWVVPVSATPVDVSTVRGSAGPVNTGLSIAFNQITAPADCVLDGGIISYNGTQYVCVTSLTNPATTAGDMIVATTGGALTRLPVGASPNGDVLTLVNGLPAWSAAASGMVYPSAGVANSTGTTWGASYTVGTAANDLVQLNASGQLPAVSAALLTNFPLLNQNTTGNAATATSLASTPTLCSTGQAPTGILASGNATGCAAIGGGSGTVTSVGLALPGIFSVSGSPVTASGTLTGSLATQAANLVFAGPSSGSAAAPTFRALVGADLPSPAASTLGGIESIASTSHQWLDSISTAGAPHASQPAFGDLSGSATCAQLPALTGDATSSAGSCATAVATMTGDSGSGGAKGLVPAPAAGTAAAGKFLKADGTWAVPSGGGSAYTAQLWQETVGPGGSGVAGGDIVPTQLSLWGIEIQHPTAVADITFMISGISGTVDASICAYGPFVSPGASLALAVSTANTGYTTTGTVKAGIAAGGTTTVQPGLYFIGVDVGSATTFNLYGTNSNDGLYFYRSNAVATSQTGACPASITAPTPSSIITNHVSPWIAFTAN